MTYQEAIDYLFAATPVFQRDGGSAYKPGLERVKALDAHYGHPHQAYHCIHIGGTNGKGSTSHTLAAILQSAGYRVGLFTSPHLVDFRERIRVNGEVVSAAFVSEFTQQAQGLVSEFTPSFFELTTMMALCYFRQCAVDVAVIEVGLGGRLDSTNIISPILSIITNISLEHTQYLGNTLEAIATEKAGIIKPSTPIVVGNASEQEVRSTLTQKAEEASAPIVWAQQENELQQAMLTDIGYLYQTKSWGPIRGELSGLVQPENTATVLSALPLLSKYFSIPTEAVRHGFSEVTSLTGLLGRWQTISKHPRIICDTGHNPAGIAQVAEQLRRYQYCYARTHIVLGMAEDKDVAAVLDLLPQHATYYFTQAASGRAMAAEHLAELATHAGLKGKSYPTVASAMQVALLEATSEGLIFVGGSNFIVADLLLWHEQRENENKQI